MRDDDENGVRRGDPEAFARWLAACEEELRLSLRRFARQVDVEAVLQEAALLVWQHAPGIEAHGGPGYLKRWALRVARNRAIDKTRRSGLEIGGSVGDDRAAPSSDLPSDPALRKRIAECFAQLPAQPRKVIAALLAAGGTFSDRDLAGSLEMSFDAFRQNRSRARRLLEACLQRFGIDLRRLLA